MLIAAAFAGSASNGGSAKERDIMPRRALFETRPEDDEESSTQMQPLARNQMSDKPGSGTPSKVFPKKPVFDYTDDEGHDHGHLLNSSRSAHFALHGRSFLVLMVLSVFFLGYKSGQTTVKPKPKEYRRFLIFAQQRSGSKFLTSLMSSHPAIACGNEELLHLNITDIESYLKMVTGTFTQLVEGNGIHSPESTAHIDTVTHVGFKIMYDQGPLQLGEELLDRLDALGIKIIHLVRQNKLLQYVSYAANKKDRLENADSHQAHPTTEEEIKALSEIRITGTVKQVSKFLDKKYGDVNTITGLLEKKFKTDPDVFETVIYEDLSDDMNKEMARLFKHLGVPVRPVQTDLAKIHKDKKIHEYFVEEDQEPIREYLQNSSEYSFLLDQW